MILKLPNLKNVHSPWINKRVLAYNLSFQEIESFSRYDKVSRRPQLNKNERLELPDELFSAGTARA